MIREAIQIYADMEDHLDKIEDDPAFQEMMRHSAQEIREGGVIPHEEVIRSSRGLGKQKRKKKRRV